LGDTTAVPVLVQSVSRDPVETLNSLLRNSGLAAHCTWIPSVQDVPDALEQLNPELVVVFAPSPEQLAAHRHGARSGGPGRAADRDPRTDRRRRHRRGHGARRARHACRSRIPRTCRP
jgi:hypothetical protein